jgi:hypothetical protein
MTGPDFASIGGIVIATMVIVQILKRAIGTTSTAAGAVPTWIYAVIVATGLTLLARFGLGTLAGDWWTLVVQAICNAAIAGGFYSWMQTGSAGIEQSGAAMKPTSQDWRLNSLLCVLCASAVITLSSGCAMPAQQYITADRATLNAVGPEYSNYVQTDPGLTPEQQQRRLRTVETWRMRVEAAEK